MFNIKDENLCGALHDWDGIKRSRLLTLDNGIWYFYLNQFTTEFLFTTEKQNLLYFEVMSTMWPSTWYSIFDMHAPYPSRDPTFYSIYYRRDVFLCMHIVNTVKTGEQLPPFPYFFRQKFRIFISSFIFNLEI